MSKTSNRINPLKDIMIPYSYNYSALEALKIMSTITLIKKKYPDTFNNLADIEREDLAIKFEATLDNLNKTHGLGLSTSTLQRLAPADIQKVIDAISENFNFLEFVEECIEVVAMCLNYSQAIASDTEINLILKLIGNAENKTVFEGNAGVAAIAAKMKVKRLILQDSNSGIAILATIFLALLDKNFKYSVQDCLSAPNVDMGGADIAIMRPPLGKKLADKEKVESQPYLIPGLNLKIPSTAHESLWIQLALYSIKETGKAFVSVLPAWLSNRGYDGKIRKHLIENDLIDSIVILPTGYFVLINSQIVLVVLKKAKSKSQPIRMIDARDLGKGKFEKLKIADSDITLISELISDKGLSHAICKDLNLTEIKKNNYSLEFNRYLFNEVECLNQGIDVELKKLANLAEHHSKAQKKLIDLLNIYKESHS